MNPRDEMGEGMSSISTSTADPLSPSLPRSPSQHTRTLLIQILITLKEQVHGMHGPQLSGTQKAYWMLEQT